MISMDAMGEIKQFLLELSVWVVAPLGVWCFRRKSGIDFCPICFKTRNHRTVRSCSGDIAGEVAVESQDPQPAARGAVSWGSRCEFQFFVAVKGDGWGHLGSTRPVPLARLASGDRGQSKGQTPVGIGTGILAWDWYRSPPAREPTSPCVPPPGPGRGLARAKPGPCPRPMPGPSLGQFRIPWLTSPGPNPMRSEPSC
jgi:hypothetical protein